ncbi:hypothetical protein B0H11DRAFT_452398 [Mycena galericulata]|nr:hypothetical protein B0H11DRAFT_452398 [Mycena galericulata]
MRQLYHTLSPLTGLQFKFQTDVAETPHALTDPITRPQILSCVDLKVEVRPSEIQLDRSYSNLGFIVHRPHSIAGREYLPRGFEPPAAKATYGTQKSTQNTGSLTVGLDSMKPTFTATASTSRGTGETVQWADDKPIPPCRVKEQFGKEWDVGDKSYSSYDLVWQPTADEDGSPRPADIRFGMGIEFYGKEERYITKLPSISHILRNQIIIWVNDPGLKAKVRGMVVLTTTYIPDIKISEPLSIVEDIGVDLAIDRPFDPPGMDTAHSVHGATNSVAIGLFDERKEPLKDNMRKFMSQLTFKSSRHKTKKPVLIDLPLHEYVARGWDRVNEQWRNTVWPTLDADFFAVPPPSAAWKLTLNPGTQTIPERDTVVRGVEAGDEATAGHAPLESRDEEMLGPDARLIAGGSIFESSGTDSGSSASGSKVRIAFPPVGHGAGGQGSSTESGSEGMKHKPYALMEVDQDTK